MNYLQKNDDVIFSNTSEDVEKLSRTYMNSPTHIEIKATGITTDKIEHTLLR